MDPLSNIGQATLILRQRLLQRLNAEERRRNAPADDKGRSPAPASEGVQRLAAIETLDDRQLRRAFVEYVLAEQFGAEMVNDAKFQQVVHRVVGSIEAEPASLLLLERALHDLRDRRP